MSKKNLARAAVVTGLAAGLVLPAAAGAFASTDSNQLEPKTDNIRIWGPTRAETSVEAVKRLEKAGAVANETDEVFLVGGNAFADPLALSTLSDCRNTPVLMTTDANTLPKTVADKLKSINPARVTIVGGELSVSPAVEEAVQKAVKGAKVTRVAGETRYDTSYDIAAYTVACYNDTYAALQAKRDATYNIEKTEAQYQQALRDFEAARSAYATEDAKLAAANNKVAAISDQISKLMNEIKETGPLGILKDDVADAKEVLDLAKAERDAQAAANAFITEELSNLGKDNSTLSIKSNLSDYRKLLADKAELLAKFDKAVKTVGVAETTSVEEAIATSNDKVKAAQKALDVAGADYAKKVEALQTTLDNTDANKAVNAKVVAAQRDLAKALDEQKKQAAVTTKAHFKMNDAAVKLAAAALGRPAPNELAKAKKALRDAIDAEVAKGGKATVFLADGTRFPDALVGGPAAAYKDGVVLLSEGANLPAATDKYLKAAKAQVVTVGVPAAEAVKGDRVITIDQQFSGQTRYDTAAAITKYYFGMDTDANHEAKLNARPLAIASGEQFADAVLAANYIAQFDGGVLLTQKNEVPVPTLNYLNNFSESKLKGKIRAFGGPIWLSDGVLNTLVKYSGQ